MRGVLLKPTSSPSQPGARKEDLAASIFQAVVNQTITGQPQGRPIEGRWSSSGAALLLKGLRERFQETLKLDADHAFSPSGASTPWPSALRVYADENAPETTLSQVMERIKSASEESHSEYRYLEPLFKTGENTKEFSRRHSSATVEERDLSSYEGSAYLGIDCGSTTTKLVLIGQEAEIYTSTTVPTRATWWSWFAGN